MANNQEVKLPASEFTEQTVANITEAGTSDFVAGYTLSGGKANRKFSLSNIANYVLNKFKLSLGGSRQTVKSAIDTLNSNVNRTKFLVISSANYNTIRISGVTYGATAAIPCFIGTKFGVMNVSRSGSVMNVPTFYGTDKPTNTITKAQDSDGTFHFDISVDTWTSCMFIWRRDTDTVDANVSISAIDT